MFALQIKLNDSAEARNVTVLAELLLKDIQKDYPDYYDVFAATDALLSNLSDYTTLARAYGSMDRGHTEQHWELLSSNLRRLADTIDRELLKIE